jgi:general secretion pathway protein K
VDWRTPGELVHPNGAKAPEYRAAGRDYGPPDAPIQDVSELAGVLGMTPEILQRLLPHLSVYAPDAPDPTLADAVVARALVDAGEPGARFDEGDNGVTFAISATALGPGDERFRRHAVVTTADATPSTPFRVLSWDQ